MYSNLQLFTENTGVFQCILQIITNNEVNRSDIQNNAGQSESQMKERSKSKTVVMTCSNAHTVAKPHNEQR